MILITWLCWEKGHNELRKFRPVCSLKAQIKLKFEDYIYAKFGPAYVGLEDFDI